MSKDLLVLADEYAAATATFARALALKDEADSMSPIARDAGDKRAVLAEALAALDTAQPVQVNAMLLTAAMDLRHALSNVLQRIPSGEWPKWLAVRDEADKMITAAKQAQPERAPLSDAELEQEFCNITGLETGINPAAADTKRALVWFKKGYAHGIKQGGQQ